MRDKKYIHDIDSSYSGKNKTTKNGGEVIKPEVLQKIIRRWKGVDRADRIRLIIVPNPEN